MEHILLNLEKEKKMNKSNIKFNGIKYADTETDWMWLEEAEKLQRWITGKGADIGCGQRSIKKDIIRVDIDKNVKPDILCDGIKLPFKDEELDYITSIHSFEHFDDQYSVLKEWLRVVKKGGIIGIVHPDVDYTKKQNPEIDNDGLKQNPFNKHWHENNLETFIKQIEGWKELPFKVIDSGVACEYWSFYLIIEKI